MAELNDWHKDEGLKVQRHQGVSCLPNHLLADRAHLHNLEMINGALLMAISTSSSSSGTVSFSHTALMQCFTAEHSLAWGNMEIKKLKGKLFYETWGRLAHQ